MERKQTEATSIIPLWKVIKEAGLTYNKKSVKMDTPELCKPYNYS